VGVGIFALGLWLGEGQVYTFGTVVFCCRRIEVVGFVAREVLNKFHSVLVVGIEGVSCATYTLVM
jgi:hypothetical protein